METLDDILRTIHPFPGIVGIFTPSPEVKAVYPLINSTVRPHRTDITFRQGESFEINVTVQDDADDPELYDVTNCLLRFAVKLGSGVVPGDDVATIGLEGSHIVKRSPSQIQLTTKGHAKIRIEIADTAAHPLGSGYTWDLEVIRPTSQVETIGQIKLKNGSDIVMGFGTQFRNATPGDILITQGVKSIITEIIGSDAIRSENSTWTDDRRADYEIWKVESRIVASGRWICISNATSP